MLSWIRDVPSLGDAARLLQRNVTEKFIEIVSDAADAPETVSTVEQVHCGLTRGKTTSGSPAAGAGARR